MIKKILIFLTLIFLLFTSNIYAQWADTRPGPSEATMSELCNMMMKTLASVGFEDIGVDMRKDDFGVVDFDIYFDDKPTGNKFYRVAGSVVGIIAALTKRTKWKSNKVYFCVFADINLPNYDGFAWIYTKDCRMIMAIESDAEKATALKEKIHINKKKR